MERGEKSIVKPMWCFPIHLKLHHIMASLPFGNRNRGSFKMKILMTPFRLGNYIIQIIMSDHFSQAHILTTSNHSRVICASWGCVSRMVGWNKSYWKLFSQPITHTRLDLLLVAYDKKKIGQRVWKVAIFSKKAAKQIWSKRWKGKGRRSRDLCWLAEAVTSKIFYCKNHNITIVYIWLFNTSQL